MKVRNLTQYLNLLLGEDRPTSFNACNTALLSKLQGENTDMLYYIDHISDFANNSNAQIFYELLQNASDANASMCYIGFNEAGFVVINNGSPFYSDNKVEEPGRLRSFLAKNKGAKYHSPDAIGKHGQGSKLIYDLLFDTTPTILSKEDRIRSLIKDELRGPILFSWNNISAFQSLLNWIPGDPLDQYGNCLDLGNPLLTKIIYTFYPVALNEQADIDGSTKTLFSGDELASFVELLNMAVAQMPNHASFYEGSALYIPLGSGRHEKLSQKLTEEIEAGLSTSLVLLPKMQSIQINENHYRKLTTFREEKLHLTEGDHADDKAYSAKFYYPIDPENVNGKLSNFFQYFPITEEIHGLKFIIDSEAYKITKSRQTIDLNDERTIEVIREIGEKIGLLIKKTAQAGNTDKLLQITSAILATDVNDIKRDIIKKHLHDNLIETIVKHIPTDRGVVCIQEHEGEIVIKNSQLEVTSAQLGLNVHWVNEKLKPYSEKLSLPVWDIQHLFENFSTNELCSSWLNGLDVAQYKKVLDELSILPDDVINNTPFVRFSDGNTYSILQLKNNTDLLIIDFSTSPLREILDKSDILYGGLEILEHESMYRKIHPFYDTSELVANILVALDFSTFNRDEKWLLFRTLRDRWKLSKDELRKLPVFSSKEGDLTPLSSLIKPSNNWVRSEILESFLIHPAEVLFNELDEYLMQESEAWEVLLDNWGIVTELLKLDTFQIVADDLQQLYKVNGKKNQLPSSFAWLLNQLGNVVKNEDIFFNENMFLLSTEEYQKLTAFLVEATDLSILHEEVVNGLKTGQYEFAPSPSIYLENVAARCKEVEENSPATISEEALSILSKCKKQGTSFFTYFKVRQSGNDLIEIWPEQPGIQYFTRDAAIVQFLSKQNNYFLLPENLFSYFRFDENLWGDFGDKIEVFATKLIDKFGAMPEFIDLVYKCSNVVKLHYISLIKEINLYSDNEVETYSNQFEGKLINLAAVEQQEARIKDKIFINDKPLSHYSYRDEVTVPYFSKEIVFSLSRLLPEYEGESDALLEIREKLKPLRMGRLFTAQLFDIDRIEAEIFKNKIITHPDQLVFSVAYREQSEKTDNSGLASLQWEQHISQWFVLDEFFSREVNNFAKELSSKLFDPSQYFLASDIFLLAEEQIPAWVSEWIKNSAEDRIRKEKYLFDNNLRKEDDPAVKLRQCIANNNITPSDIITGVVSDKTIAGNTFKWILEHQHKSGLSDNNLSTLRGVINGYCEQFKELPSAILTMNFTENIRYNLSSLNTLLELRCYLTSWEDTDIEIIKTAQHKYSLAIVDAKTYAYNENYRTLLRKSGINEARLEHKFAPKSDVHTSEWEANQYREWKGKYPNFSILITGEEIPFQYDIIIEGGQPLPVGEFPKGKAARDDSDQDQIKLIVFHTGNNLLPVIKAHKDTLFPDDKVPLMDLLEEFAIGESDWQLLNAAKEKGLTGQQIQQIDSEILDVVTNSGLSKAELQNFINNPGYDLGKELSDEEIDTLKKLLNRTDAEKLKSILRNLDKIEQLLESEDDESTPNLLLGYIGEVLVRKWLELEHGEDAVAHVAIQKHQNSVEQTKTPYDIVLKKDKTYLIDVKTTQKPVRENSAVAFFIQDLEYNYIKNNTTDPYFIYRISLKDLGLLSWYKNIPIQGQEFEEIINMHNEHIEQKISEYLSDASKFDLVRKNRLAFRVTIPPDQDKTF